MAFCMDVGGERSGAVSASMNMVGNLGAALSAILFPYFVSEVTLPGLVETTGTANAFFVLAAALNMLAALAWLRMNPARKLGAAASAAGQRARAFAFAYLILGVLAALIYATFFLNKN